MKTTVLAIIISLLTLSSSAFAQEANDWHTVANAIPLGSKVKVRTINGDRYSGTLMRVDDSSVMVKRSARVPEPALTVTFDRVANLERDHGSGGFSWGKALAVGVGTGVGAILTMLVIALQID